MGKTKLQSRYVIWRPIPSFPQYEASSRGEIRSISHGVIAPASYESRDGYSRIRVRQNKKVRLVTVHSLVCSAFHGPRPDGKVCAHFDGDRTNNAPHNLRWCSRSENEKDKVRHGTSNQGARNGQAKLTPEAVKDILADPNSQQRIAEVYGVAQQTVSKIKRRARWGHVRSEVVFIRSSSEATPRGENSVHAKLNEATVSAIRKATGTLAEIASEFGTSWQNVDTIRSRRTWRHIGD